MAKAKETAEALQAAVELQLSERRFILESINTVTGLLQVPIVTAFVWFYMSRTNVTLGALNKAILTAELAPLIGDINFPEGVLLGAAMESTEDFLVILEKAGLLDKDEIIAGVQEGLEDFGDVAAKTIVNILSGPQNCSEANIELDRLYLLSEGTMRTPQGVVDDPDRQGFTGDKVALKFAYTFQLQAMKAKGCPRPEHPHFVSEETWADV